MSGAEKAPKRHRRKTQDAGRVNLQQCGTAQARSAQTATSLPSKALQWSSEIFG